MASNSAAPEDRTLVRLLLVVLAIIVIGPVLLMSIAMPAMGVMGGWWHGPSAGGMGPWWGFGISLVWLVVLLVIGYVTYRIVAGREATPVPRDTALEELRLAYARGDLTAEEFEERRAVLAGDR